MKKKIITFTMSLILIMLCSCHIKVTDESLMRSACSYAVPGMYQRDLKGSDSSYDIVETDQYGRILLRTQSYYAFTDQIEQVLIILQKKESEHIYFYEDACYLLFDPTDEEIELLKEHNDWDEKINETKLSTRLIRESFDMYLIYPYDDQPEWREIVQSFCDEIGIMESQIANRSITDIDSSGNELLWFKVQSEEGGYTFYWVIAYKDETVKVMQINDIDKPTEDLITFKSNSNWNNYDE